MSAQNQLNSTPDLDSNTGATFENCRAKLFINFWCIKLRCSVQQNICVRIRNPDIFLREIRLMVASCNTTYSNMSEKSAAISVSSSESMAQGRTPASAETTQRLAKEMFDNISELIKSSAASIFKLLINNFSNFILIFY